MSGRRRPSSPARSRQRRPRPALPAAAAGSPGPDCHNCHAPACGDFSWSPAPSNSPLQWQIAWEPQQPKVGDVVTIHFAGSDAESKMFTTDWCYGEAMCLARTDGPSAGPVGYGPWSPPPGRPSSIDDVTQHPYGKSGTFTVKVLYTAFGYLHPEDCPGNPSSSAGGGNYFCNDPYAEWSTARPRSP